MPPPWVEIMPTKTRAPTGWFANKQPVRRSLSRVDRVGVPPINDARAVGFHLTPACLSSAIRVTCGELVVPDLATHGRNLGPGNELERDRERPKRRTCTARQHIFSSPQTTSGVSAE